MQLHVCRDICLLSPTCNDFDLWPLAAVNPYRRHVRFSPPSPPATLCLDLQIFPFKGLPPLPPPAVLLNKQPGPRWEAPTLRRSLSVCFMYLARFTDSNTAILTPTPGLQGDSPLSVLQNKAGLILRGRKPCGCVCGKTAVAAGGGGV